MEMLGITKLTLQRTIDGCVVAGKRDSHLWDASGSDVSTERGALRLPRPLAQFAGNSVVRATDPRIHELLNGWGVYRLLFAANHPTIALITPATHGRRAETT